MCSVYPRVFNANGKNILVYRPSNFFNPCFINRLFAELALYLAWYCVILFFVESCVRYSLVNRDATLPLSFRRRRIDVF